MQIERANARDSADATVLRGAGLTEHAEAHGFYLFECFDAFGILKWRDTIENVVCTEGKNLALDTFLAGAAYTVTGPYMGLISSVSYTAVAATDVGTQINLTNGWKEAGLGNAPTYTGNRKTIAWSAASAGSKAMSAALVFAITSAGTIKGGFVLYGSTALSTKDNAAGTIWSAGLFTAGDKICSNGDSLSATYSTSM